MEKNTMLRRKIIQVLNLLKAPKRSKGFGYIVDAVELKCETMGMKTMDVYAKIAKDRGDELTRVERAIRHEIECIMSIKETDEQKLEILNNDIRMTNTEFINCIVFYLGMI